MTQNQFNFRPAKFFQIKISKIRNEIPSMLNSLFDKPTKPQGQNQSIADELKMVPSSSTVESILSTTGNTLVICCYLN